MFGFGKKKEKTKVLKQQEEAPVLTEESKEALLRTISLKKESINQLPVEEQAKAYEEMGLAFHKLGQDDQAIEAIEKSLELKKSIDDGFKTLLRLYNKKRAEAAKLKDDEMLQTYLKKMDHLMQVSKDVTRGVM